MKEFGGYLPIELNRGEREWHWGKDVLRLNCGRTAIITAIRDAGYNKIWLPTYLCESVIDILEKNQIEYCFYNINESLRPLDVELQENEGILIVNYFGLFSSQRLKELAAYYQNVIIDNTQSFFSEPITYVYNVYSCRKFIGVSDGAYLIKQGIHPVDYEMDYSASRSTFLLSSLERGTNAVYQENLKNEAEIDNAGLLQMSKLTRSILSSVDYEQICKVRRSNYKMLHLLLKNHNELSTIDIGDNQIPMVYPFLYTKADIREEVIRRCIYVPQWWKCVLENPHAGQVERKLSRYLLPLPIDQRYDAEEMKEVASLIKTIIGS